MKAVRWRRVAVALAASATALAAACAVSVDDFPVGTGELGARCDDAAPCVLGLRCWGAGAAPRGPAGGLCTLDCRSDADCPASGACTLVDGVARCLQKCAVGDGDGRKCQGRRDMGCGILRREDGTSIQVCRPVCNADADCSGRFCDRRTGLCTDETPTGAPAGAACTPPSSDATPDPCRGTCTELTATTQICIEVCTLGALETCTDTGAAVDEVTCADVANTSVTTGDVAVCTPECRCNEECPGALVCNLERNGTRYCGVPFVGLGLGVACSE